MKVVNIHLSQEIYLGGKNPECDFFCKDAMGQLPTEGAYDSYRASWSQRASKEI